MKNEIEILEDLLAKNKEAKERLSLQLAPLQKKQDKLFNQGRKLREELDLALIETEKPNWDWILYEDGGVSKTRYDYAEKKIRELGLMVAVGYFPDTQQKVIRIALVNGKRETVKITKKAIETLLPFIKIHDGDNYKGYKAFSIFESSCSENGSHALLIGNNEFIVHRTYYYRPEVLKKCKTLDEALNYIYVNLYYEKVNDDLTPTE